MVNFHQNGRTELQAKLTERSAEPVRSISAERSAEPFGFGRTLYLEINVIFKKTYDISRKKVVNL